MRVKSARITASEANVDDESTAEGKGFSGFAGGLNGDCGCGCGFSTAFSADLR